MNKIYEIDEDTFRQLIKDSYSYSDFFRKTNIGRGLNAVYNLLKRCDELDISLDHFNKQQISKIDLLTDDEFINLANQATSYSNLLNLIGIQHNCDLTNRVRKRCKDLGIYFSTKKYVTQNKKINLKDILIENSNFKNTPHLKKRLIEEGYLEYKCAICGNVGEWNNQPLVLQLDHINGNHTDNRIENLRILCPNCHTQTETYCSKRGTKSVK